MPQRIRVLAVLSLLLLPLSARASLFGEENGPLTTLVAQAAVQISQFAETLSQLRQTYDETKRYVGMVEDAVSGFQSFASWGQSVLKDPLSALDALNSDLGYLRRDISSPQSWAQGTGELQRRMRLCIAGSSKCTEFYEATRASQARDAIKATYGVTPRGRRDLDATDVEAAGAISGGSQHLVRAAVSKEQAEAMKKQCLTGSDAKAMQACQAAANTAQLLALQEAAATNEQLAEANRLAAIRLATEASFEKRAAAKAAIEAAQREELFKTGNRALTPSDVVLKAY